jgi:ZIP family zinc transporter
MTNVWFALGLTVFAGLATGVGSAIAFFGKRTNYRFLSVSTGFSAGVMLYVSFVEIFYKGLMHWQRLTEITGGTGLIRHPSLAACF